MTTIASPIQPPVIRRAVPGVLTVSAVIIAWKLVSLFFPPVFLPGPVLLAKRIAELYADPASWVVVGETLGRIFAGFVISMLVGAAVGLLMGVRREIAVFLDSWIMVLLSFPAVCWAFLSVLWFGISDTAPIVTIVLIVFPFVTMNVWAGTKAVERDLTAMGKVYRADRSLMLRKVFVPQLMPYVFSSLRIALSLSWKIALVAEAFGVGNGVGQKLIYWFQDTRVDMMLAWGLSFMFLMVAIDLLLFRTWARRTFAWRPHVAT